MIPVSEKLDEFLSFLRQSKIDYKVLQSKETDLNDAIQDIQHNLEFEDHSYHEYARLSKATKSVRNERREVKKDIELLKGIVDWANENDKVIKDLERLLGNLRKTEKLIESRQYKYRTSIVEDTLYSNKK